MGKPVSVQTDHKSLVPSLTTHRLDQLPPRIQKFRMRLMRFHLKEVKQLPGKKMFRADALSRLQVCKQAKPQPTIGEQEMTAHIGSVLSILPVSGTMFQQIMKAQDGDTVCR